MQLNFTVTCTLEIKNQAHTARVNSVVTQQEEDISRHFLSFCEQADLALSNEEQIRKAIYEYGKKHYH
jgi:hypothetical protein